jgi:acyl-CoA synthetase (AMP-forming)/AMP-acid ligase II
MKGYWKDPEATGADLRDGWLHTGDIGEFDADGYIKITDRKKDIIVVSGGDNIAPQRVEGVLMLEPEIGQALAYGDRRPNLVALISPHAEFLKRFAREHKRQPDQAALADGPGPRRGDRRRGGQGQQAPLGHRARAEVPRGARAVHGRERDDDTHAQVAPAPDRQELRGRDRGALREVRPPVPATGAGGLPISDAPAWLGRAALTAFRARGPALPARPLSSFLLAG